MERKEFAVIFGVMCEYFGASPSDGLTDIYYQDLNGWTMEQFKEAFFILRSRRVYNGLPKIAEIKEAIEGKIEDKVALAYQTLIETLRDHSYWDSVIFEDGAIGKTVETMGGWIEISQWSIEDWKFRKKEFDALYLANLRNGNIKPLRLIGQFESINIANKHEDHIPEPIRIGTLRKILELEE